MSHAEFLGGRNTIRAGADEVRDATGRLIRRPFTKTENVAFGLSMLVSLGAIGPGAFYAGHKVVHGDKGNFFEVHKLLNEPLENLPSLYIEWMVGLLVVAIPLHIFNFILNPISKHYYRINHPKWHDYMP